MADRSVTVRLKAVTTDFQNAMARAGASVDNFGDHAEGALDTASVKVAALGRAGQVMGGALVLGAGLAVKSFMDFDKQMSQVGAVSGASVADLERLKDAALEAGAQTAFSASEAAAAQAELAKAGLTTADILGGALTGSLSLAAAGGLDLAQAATISAQAMNMFGLAGSDVSHIADLLAAGANKSAADVSSLGAALSQSGMVAAQTGLSIEESVAALSAFADNALIGSDAGTSFKAMLQRLTPQSAEAQRAMDDLGISAYDARGNFIGLEAFAGQLQTAMADLTPEARNAAMGVIFGADAVRAANVLYAEGADGIREYTTAVDDQGAAARVAGDLMDNLSGDLEALRGSIETTLIQGGSGANDALRGLVQNTTTLVNVVGRVPEPLLTAGFALGAMGGAALLMLPGLARAKQSLQTLGLTADTTRGKLALLGKGAGVAALSMLAIEAIIAEGEFRDLIDSVDDLQMQLSQGIAPETGAYEAKLAELRALQDDLTSWDITDLSAQWSKLTTGGFTGLSGIVGTARRLGLEIEQSEQAMAAYEAQVLRVATALNTTEDSAARFLDEAAKMGVIGRLAAGYLTVEEAAIALAQANTDAAPAISGVEANLQTLGDEAATADEQLRAFTSSMDVFLETAFGMTSATARSRKAFRDLTDSLKENGITWDVNTEKGYANIMAFEDAIQASTDVAVAKYKETGSIEEANTAYEKSIRAGLKAAGMTDKQREAVMRLIGKEGLGSLPPEYFTEIVVDTSDAVNTVNDFYAWLASLPGSKSVDIKAEWYGTGQPNNTATGGVRKAGQPLFVGEMGRELFVPQVDGRIVPNHEVEKWTRATASPELARNVDNSRKLADNINVQVQSAPGEKAADTLPRRLRHMAFLEGLNN